jgi:DNA-binding NarL/FixJ family response regulator
VPKRILIADDHKSALRSVRLLLESHPGWEICGEAIDGREAVTKTVELKPDLVVLDFAMPHVDGLKAASEITALLPDVQIVLHTMYGSGVRSEAEKHGITRLVDKAQSGALVSAIEELLGAQPQPARNGLDSTTMPVSCETLDSGPATAGARPELKAN